LRAIEKKKTSEKRAKKKEKNQRKSCPHNKKNHPHPYGAALLDLRRKADPKKEEGSRVKKR